MNGKYAGKTGYMTQLISLLVRWNLPYVLWLIGQFVRVRTCLTVLPCVEGPVHSALLRFVFAIFEI